MLTSEPPAPAPASATITGTGTGADAPGATRVVVIDDTADLRNLLRLVLVRGGFRVVAEAADGVAGIEAVRRELPDVVLLDIAMPRMDGLEALPTLRRTCPSAKIIAMSAFGATQMAARAVAAGADGYVQKGTSLHSILGYVERIAGVPTRPARPEAITAGRNGERSLRAVRPVPPAQRSAAADHDGARRSAIDHAPYGMLEVTDEAAPRVRWANPVAERLLGGAPASGALLSLTAPGLAHHVAAHRHESDAVFDALVDAGTVRATLRRSTEGIFVYLDSAGEDVGLLRRAIATAAHELRGPIAVIDGVVEAVSWGLDTIPPAEQDALLTSVKRQVAQLDRVTADLFTATQVSRGTLFVDLHAFDAAELVREIFADQPDVHIDAPEPAPVLADPLRLEQMLGNLLSNATKYGAAPYAVSVRRASGGTAVRIDVADRGPGVPEDFESQLFREFSRPARSVATGTGLGLYVVRILAEAQGGAATHRRHPEGGAIFTVQLPSG